MDPLFTGDELKDYMQRPALPDAQAELAAAGASGIIRDHCGWTLTREDGVTFTVDGSGVRVLSLPTLHMPGVQEVRVNGEVLDPALYSWALRGQLYKGTPWSTWQQIDVVCDSGYAELPDAVKIVGLSLGSRLVDNPTSLKTASVGSVQRTFPGVDLTILELRLLDRYRLP